ncbi:unnamed protein product [Clavelina lepadiformis]|uniref:Uncharacterized protein n=1 Tax=Clavelina lepadiformis TaxID=159417 RepID=A0ABP0FMG5_CLALP
MRKEDLLLRIEVQLLIRCEENFAFIPLERSVNVVRSKRRSQQADNVALLPNSIIDYNFTPHQAIGDLGGTGHVVCIDVNAGCLHQAQQHREQALLFIWNAPQ